MQDKYENKMAGKILSFWSWNGAIDKEGITEQLEDFADGRFDGVVIHARAGLLVPYLSDLWFSLFAHAVKEAGRLGLDIFIYDEDGWPSGFAGGIVPNCGNFFRLKYLKTGYIKSSVISENFIAAYRYSDCGYNEISYCKSGDGDLFLWYEIDSDYVDLLSEETVRKFICSTHEQYRKHFSKSFGTIIKGIFTDEPQLNGYIPWSPHLEKAYYDIFREPLRPLMWMLVIDSGDYKSFRSKYYTAVRRQLSHAFTEQIGKWCADNDLIFTGHFGNEDGLCMQIPSNGGVMPQYRFMQLPGIDHLGNRITSPVLVKQASSVSRQFSDGSVLSETFGCSGWDVELPRLAWLWGRQTALGVTTACCHLSAYSTAGIRKRDYPAFFSRQSPFWKMFGSLKFWMSAISGTMSEGVRETDTLVISPLNTVAAYYNGSYDSERMRCCSANFRILLENLLDLQLDADIGDEELILRDSCIKNGKFFIGKNSYSNVFVADCDSLLSHVRMKLKMFAEQGGRLIFINHRPGLTDFKTHSDEIFENNIVIPNRRALIEKYLLNYGIKRKVRLLNNYDLSTESGFLMHIRRIDAEYRVQICGKEDSDSNVIFQIEGDFTLIKRNLKGGSNEELPSIYSAGRTSADIRISRMENVVIDAVKKTEDAPFYRRTSLLCLYPNRVYTTEKNSLTLDYARYILEGKISDEMPVIKAVPQIYSCVKRCGAPAEVEFIYTFNIASDTVAMNLTLALEDASCSSFAVNGHTDALLVGKWIDRSISEYDISGFVFEGENRISVKYIINDKQETLNESETFETRRNRFFYPVEPENIYIRGNFDTVPDSDYTNYIDHFRVKGRFKIRKRTEKQFGELTVQGLWFYRGDAVYVFDFECRRMPDKCILTLENAHCAAFSWQLNNEEGNVVTYPLADEITKGLKVGTNRLIIHIIGSNRNLLGPHHHVKGRNMFVGVHTFLGTYGFEDFVSPELRDKNTWNDEYSFVPFNCGNVFLEFYDKKEENL